MNTEKGITLIALIITIIVMIILVAVTVAVSLNGGLFNKAQEATLETVIAELQEIVDMKKVETTAEVVSGKIDGEELDDEEISELLEDPLMLNNYALIMLIKEKLGEENVDEYFNDLNIESEDNEQTLKLKLRPELLESLGINTRYGKGEEDFVVIDETESEYERVKIVKLENDVFLLRLWDMKVLYRDKNGTIHPLVDISQNIKTDGNGTITCFEYEYGLEEITVPTEINGEKITAIADCAFCGLNLKRNEDGTVIFDSDGIPEILDSWESRGENAKIKSIIIPEGITTIGMGAFGCCDELENIKLPSGLTRIEKSTFADCTKLKYIKIPDTVTYIGEKAFWESGLKEIVIPNSVTYIGPETFSLCDQLEKVVLSDNIEELPGGYEIGIFYGCDNLKEVQLPKNLKKIGEDTFDLCNNLKEITIPSSVVDIHSSAFYHNGMEKIYFEPRDTELPTGSPWGAKSDASIEILPAE